MLRKRLSIIGWILMVVLPFAFNYTILTQPTNVDEVVERLEMRVPHLLDRYKVPGVAIAIIENSRVQWTGYFGEAKADTNDKINIDTVFQVASLSKPVTALGVMRLVEMDKIQLDDPVGQYLTRWHLPKSIHENDGVTVRKVLSHTAGLSLGGYPGSEPTEALPSLEESLSGHNSKGVEVAVIGQPGSMYRYSGGGYTLLQLLIEEVSGMPYSVFMKQDVLKPLGMNSSTFDPQEINDTKLGRGHDRQMKVLPNYRFTELAAAGLYTTIGDMGKLVLAEIESYNGSGLISKESMDEVYHPEANIKAMGETIYAGLGHFINQVSGVKVVSHDGSNRGWKSSITIIPNQKAGIVIMTNGDNGSAIIGDVLDSWYYAQFGTHRLMNKVKYWVTSATYMAALGLLLASALALGRLIRHPYNQVNPLPLRRQIAARLLIVLFYTLLLYLSMTVLSIGLGYLDPSLGRILIAVLMVRTIVALVEVLPILLRAFISSGLKA